MVTTRTLHEGMVVDATVFKMYDWGMLIRLQNGLKAVVMKEECADHEVASARELYTEGDKVRAVITKVDLSNHKTEASLKPSRLNSAARDAISSAVASRRPSSSVRYIFVTPYT